MKKFSITINFQHLLTLQLPTTSAFSKLRPTIATFAPWAAYPFAIADPNTPFPPIATAVFPLKSNNCDMVRYSLIVKINSHFYRKEFQIVPNFVPYLDAVSHILVMLLILQFHLGLMYF